MTFFKAVKHKKKRSAVDAEAASFTELLRYATLGDYVLLGVAVVSSLCAGVCFPVACALMQRVHAAIIEAQSFFDQDRQDEVMDSLTEIIVRQCIYVALNGLVMFIFGYVSMLSFYVLCERQVVQIRKEFLLKVLSQDMEWFDGTDPGAVTLSMASGFERIREGMSDKIGVLLLSLSSLAIGIIYALYINWKLALVLLAVTPLIVLSMLLSIRTIIEAGRNQLQQYSAAGSIAHEVVSSIKTVISFNGQFFEIDRYKKCLDLAKRIGIKKAVVTGFFTGLYVVVLYASVGLAFWYGTQLAIAGDIQPGLVLAVFWAVIFGALQIGQALPSISSITGAKVAAGQIFETIDRKPKMISAREKRTLDSIQGCVRLHKVRFAYPSRANVPVLKGVSLTVEAGQKVGLVGYSGCGKSTVFSLLTKLYRAEQGRVEIDGHSVDELDTNWLRRNIGYVDQDSAMFSDTVEVNLRMGNSAASEKQMMEACRTANCHAFIEKLPRGYQTLIGEGGVKLSGGQKQRLAIARAVIKDPKILLLDEATSALDSGNEQLVQEALDSACRGRTTIVIAHRLSTIRNADVIYVFKDGAVVESGKHEQLMADNGFYAQLVAAQQIQMKQQQQQEAEERPEEDFLSGDVQESDKLSRISLRLSRSLSNVRRLENQADVEDIEEELRDEGADQASVRDIFRYCKPEMKYIVAGVCMSLVRGLQWPLFAVLVGQILLILACPDPLEATRMSYQVSLLFAAVGLMGGLSTLVSGSLLGAAGEKMAARLRLAVFRNILRQDGYFFDQARHSVEKLTTRLATDAHNVQAAVDQRLSEVLQGVTSLVVGVAFAFYTSPSIAPICLVSNVLLAVIQIAVGSYLKQRGGDDARAGESASQIAGEAIRNVKTVQILVQQEHTFALFCQALKEPYRRAISRGLFQSLIFAIAIAFTCFNFSLTYSTGVLMIRSGFTTPYKLFQVIESLHMAAMLIIAAANYFPEYVKARLSGGLMFRMLKEEPRIDSYSEGGLKRDIQGTITVKNLKFSYPNSRRQLALDGLSLTALAGQNVALVGPSGCGKSTTVQLIERFYDPMSGVITIDGIDLRELNLRHVRGQVAIVGQDPVLFNTSIRENIAYALSGVTTDEVEAAARFANIHTFVKSLPEQYETVIGANGTKLSGGQKQRLAIARAVIRKPRILLLDEATSALDSENEKLIQDALSRFKVGRTCLTIAHRLSTIQQADSIVVIKDGRSTEVGTHHELLQNEGMYSSFVAKQQMA